MVIRKRLGIEGPAMVFVTTTVKEWVPVFEDKKCAHVTLVQLWDTLVHYQATIAAYVLMPSHLHLLMGLKEVGQLSRVMQSFKSLSTRRIQESLPQRFKSQFQKNNGFRFWKPRFDDLIIWSHKQFLTKAAYIHNNPVKAGLVEQPTDYPYSSARDWLSDECGYVPVDRKWTWLAEAES